VGALCSVDARITDGQTGERTITQLLLNQSGIPTKLQLFADLKIVINLLWYSLTTSNIGDTNTGTNEYSGYITALMQRSE
jgi:hypothetical protein